MEHLSELEDPRKASNGTLHDFREILVIAVCANLLEHRSGASGEALPWRRLALPLAVMLAGLLVVHADQPADTGAGGDYGLGLARTDLLTTCVVVVDAAFFALTGLAVPVLARREPGSARGRAWIGAVAIVFALLELLAIAGSLATANVRLVALTGLAWIVVAAGFWFFFFAGDRRARMRA